MTFGILVDVLGNAKIRLDSSITLYGKVGEDVSILSIIADGELYSLQPELITVKTNVLERFTRRFKVEDLVGDNKKAIPTNPFGDWTWGLIEKIIVDSNVVLLEETFDSVPKVKYNPDFESNLATIQKWAKVTMYCTDGFTIRLNGQLEKNYSGCEAAPLIVGSTIKGAAHLTDGIRCDVDFACEHLIHPLWDTGVYEYNLTLLEEATGFVSEFKLSLTVTALGVVVELDGLYPKTSSVEDRERSNKALLAYAYQMIPRGTI